MSFLTDLYVKKGWSIRRISRELGCNKSVVRKNLREDGVEIIQQKTDMDRALVKKVKRLREQSLSYQKIADLFNLWRIETRSKEGKWYAKTVRDIRGHKTII